jgi:hypothetical protein
MLHPDLPVILDDAGHGIGPDYDAVAAARMEDAARAA